MKKVLMHASVASMIYKFNMENIEVLKNLGYCVEVACNFDEKENSIGAKQIEEFKAILREKKITFYENDCPRSIFSLSKMLRTYKQLKSIIDTGEYELIHTQSPIGSVICRLAARSARRMKTKVIYFAHGFHFYKGAPLLNWLIFYPVEKICAHLTDVLITINKEDYNLAQEKMKAKQIEYVSGVGINLNKFADGAVQKIDKRRELGIPQEASLILSIGELNENKNHETVIRAIAGMENVYYIIAGKGDLQNHLHSVINELGMTDRVKLLGYRDDISELCKAADIYAMPSYREGLSVALMEAMASGLPCVVSRIRGNTDLIDENGGALFDPNSVEDCSSCIEALLLKDLASMGQYNGEKIKLFDICRVKEQMANIYKQQLRVCRND